MRMPHRTGRERTTRSFCGSRHIIARIHSGKYIAENKRNWSVAILHAATEEYIEGTSEFETQGGI